MKNTNNGLTRRILRNQKNLRGIRLFRVAVYCAYFPFVIKQFVEQKRAKNKKDTLEDMVEGIHLYMDVGRSWIVKAIRLPLTSLVNDPELDLDVLDRKG
jgi:hypothetical protein